MRYVVSGVGVLAAALLMTAAGWMNWRFMTTLASGEADRLALGGASVGIDVMKAALAYLIALGWDRRQWGYVGIGSLTYALLAAVSLASSFGFAADNRDAVRSERGTLGARYQMAVVDLEEVEAKLKVAGTARPSAIIESEVLEFEREPRWLATKACTIIAGADSRAMCKRHAERKTESVRARAIELLEARRAALRDAILELTAQGALRQADRQGKYAEAMGLRAELLSSVLVLLLAAVLELGAGLGVYLALRPVTGNGRKVRRERSREDETRVPLVRAEVISPVPNGIDGGSETRTPAPRRPSGKVWAPRRKRRRAGSDASAGSGAP
jgi:hypothetical protein